MGHLPDPQLVQFKRGNSLAAAELNHNFATLYSLCQTAIALALTPDQATVATELRVGELEVRAGLLEHLVQMHARQRNEKEWAPLSHLGAVLVRVAQLQETVEQATAELLAAQRELLGVAEHLDRRLQRLEQQPEAAAKQDHDALFKEHHRLAELEHTLLAQVHGLRHEVGVLTKMATGHDRLANRMQYAPLSTIGHLLQRIMEVEKRLP